MNNLNPIFIVGVGRSGTSMLQSMLNSHQEITFPPETHFIRTYLAKGTDILSAKEQLLQDKDLTKLQIPLEPIINQSKNLNDFYINLLKKYMEKQNKKLVGDKDPKNIEYLQLIHSIFPNAIVIHIYRDPRAVIASRLKAQWSKNKPFWQHLLAYKSQLLYGKKMGKKLFQTYVEIKYENLIQDPKNTLEQLCKDINISFDINMLEFYKKANEVVQGEELSWKQNVFNPVMPENIDKWKQELSKDQIMMIEFILNNEMQILKYDISNTNIPFTYKTKKIFYKLFIQGTNLLYSYKLK